MIVFFCFVLFFQNVALQKKKTEACWRRILT
jgi:hypothetical protein